MALMPGTDSMRYTIPRLFRRGLTRFVWARELVIFLFFGATAALTTLSAGWVLYGGGWSIHLPYWCAPEATARTWAASFVRTVRFPRRTPPAATLSSTKSKLSDRTLVSRMPKPATKQNVENCCEAERLRKLKLNV